MGSMKVVILGAGLMGKETARDLVKSDDVEKVYLADLNVRQAEDFAEELMSDKLDILLLDAKNDVQLREVMALGDVVINALFYTFNEKVARTSCRHRCPLHRPWRSYWRCHGCGTRSCGKGGVKGVTIIPDLGVAPGMINILNRVWCGKARSCGVIKLYVGGIPVNPEPPLNYNVVFSLEGVFDHYTDPSHVIRNGKLLEIPSLSEIEPIISIDTVNWRLSIRLEARRR